MIPSQPTLAAVEAANVTLNAENAQLRQALRVIRKGLSQDADGEFWPARQWLDRRKIYHGDLSGVRVLELIAKHALHGKHPMPSIGEQLKLVEHLWNNGDFNGLIAFVREILGGVAHE